MFILSVPGGEGGVSMLLGSLLCNKVSHKTTIKVLAGVSSEGGLGKDLLPGSCVGRIQFLAGCRTDGLGSLPAVGGRLSAGGCPWFSAMWASPVWPLAS